MALHLFTEAALPGEQPSKVSLPLESKRHTTSGGSESDTTANGDAYQSGSAESGVTVLPNGSVGIPISAERPLQPQFSYVLASRPYLLIWNGSKWLLGKGWLRLGIGPQCQPSMPHRRPSRRQSQVDEVSALAGVCWLAVCVR